MTSGPVNWASSLGKYARYSARARAADWSLTRPAYCIPYPCGSMRARTRGPTRGRAVARKMPC